MFEFQCPGCRSQLTHQGDTDAGYRVCDGCGVAFPQIDGSTYFDRPTLAPSSADDLRAAMFGNEKAYAQFVADKHLRPNYDGYAAFEPFNESTRALYAFMGDIRESLAPGVPILDLWGRTGWSGISLAAWFPDNPVYLVWEGDHNVLGYKGYRYWLGRDVRPANLHIVFTDLEKPLPFTDQFFGLVHGLDTFHRYGPVPLIGECLRVARPSAPLVFPHIHLSNSEPEPFFERGCTQDHGRDYRRLMDALERSRGRRSYLLSERTLFENRESIPVVDDHEMAHYNALLYVAPVGAATSHIGPCDWPVSRIGGDTRVVLNPLVRIDAVTGVADIDTGALAGEVSHLLARHPVYEERLRRLLPVRLDDTDRKLMYGFELAMDLAGAFGLAGVSEAEGAARLAALRANELCTFGPFGAAGTRLQRFYRTQRTEHPLQAASGFREVWQALEGRDSEAPLFISTRQGVEYGLDDVMALVDTIRGRMHTAGLRAGQRVLLCSGQHPAYLLTLWAAWLSGLVVVPVCPRSHGPHLGYILDLVSPALCFVEAGVELPNGMQASAVVLDPLDDNLAADPPGRLFSDWLEEAGESAPPEYQSYETAAILFSSGTTGQPKAVVHSFGNLLRGAIKLVEFYRLQPCTRMLSAGDFHSMSGLRNAALLSLVNSHTVLLADDGRENMGLRFLEIARVYRPQLVFSSPALVETLSRMGCRLDPRHCASIDTWLCTGAPVSNDLLERLSTAWNIRFASYYGLTETGGFCAGTRPGQAHAEGELGEAAGAIFKLVDAQGATITGAEVGSLLVFSDQLMAGYLTGPEPWENGWLATGDKVRREADGRLILLGRGQDEFSNAAGEQVNLAYLETQLADQADLPFALVHDGSRLTLVLECDQAVFETLQQSRAIQPLLTQLDTRGVGALSELRVAHVTTIPRTGNGKVQRRALQQQLSS